MTTDPSGAIAAETRAILTECQAILAGDHFVYISGDHGSGWIAKDVIFVDLKRVRRLAELLAGVVRGLPVDIVCGPATGGLIVAQWTAFELGLPAVFADHEVLPSGGHLRGDFGLHRGFDRLVQNRRVLVVDDVVNTGLSIRQTVSAVRSAGGEVLAAAALVDRGNVTARDLEVSDYRYLLQENIPDWPGPDCPLCRQGVPINTQYAHGADFLKTQT